MLLMGPIYFTFLARCKPPTRSFLSHPDRLPYSSSPNAFVTYLDTPAENSHTSSVEDEDLSFTNARILTYQLLHDPKTRSNSSTPLVIFVPRTYPEAKIQRLTDDGAVVISVDGVTRISAIQKSMSYNRKTGERFEKLRMLELYEFDLVCYISPDTFLTQNMDGVFEDAAVTVIPSKGYTDGFDDSHERHEEKSTGIKRLTVPATYLFAASATKAKEGIFSERMFVIRPSLRMFDYYAALASRNSKKGHCDDLFNRAHGPKTRMPWGRLGKRWEQLDGSEEEGQGNGATMSSERRSLESSVKARALWTEKRKEMEQSLGKE